MARSGCRETLAEARFIHMGLVIWAQEELKRHILSLIRQRDYPDAWETLAEASSPEASRRDGCLTRIIAASILSVAVTDAKLKHLDEQPIRDELYDTTKHRRFILFNLIFISIIDTII